MAKKQITNFALDPDKENTYSPTACTDTDSEGNPIDNDVDGDANCPGKSVALLFACAK